MWRYLGKVRPQLFGNCGNWSQYCYIIPASICHVAQCGLRIECHWSQNRGDDMQWDLSWRYRMAAHFPFESGSLGDELKVRTLNRHAWLHCNDSASEAHSCGRYSKRDLLCHLWLPHPISGNLWNHPRCIWAAEISTDQSGVHWSNQF